MKSDHFSGRYNDPLTTEVGINKNVSMHIRRKKQSELPRPQGRGFDEEPPSRVEVP